MLLQAAEHSSAGPGRKPGQLVAQQETQSPEVEHQAAQQLPEGNQRALQQGPEPSKAEQAELQQQQPQQGPQLEQRQEEDSGRSSNETTGTVEGVPAGGSCLSAEMGRDASRHLTPAEAKGGVQLVESSAVASEGPAPVIPAGNTQACQGQALVGEEGLQQVCGMSPAYASTGSAWRPLGSLRTAAQAQLHSGKALHRSHHIAQSSHVPLEA